MKRIAVVTSSPPLAEGGHLVIARALTAALRDAGHHADIIVTPQNRFGRQASAYLATWLTDVGVSDRGPIDQVISLRFPSYAVRHRHHVCWLNHTMREYYDLWEQVQRRLERPRPDQGADPPSADSRRGPLPAHAERLEAVRPVGNDPEAAVDVARAARDACCIRRRRIGRITAIGTAISCSWCRG